MKRFFYLLCVYFWIHNSIFPQLINWQEKASKMVETQILARGVTDEKTLNIMRTTPRHMFIPDQQHPFAYMDSALPIGYNQTISQPYIVGLMTSLLQLKEKDKVLEIGTGSGYQAAILSPLCKLVFTIEIVKELADQSKKTLQQLGYNNVLTRWGDGYQGWPEEAPFDAIIVTAAPPEIPQKLIEQLKIGGRLVIPVGNYWQELKVITKQNDGTLDKQFIIPVRFVPMVHPKKPIPNQK